MDILEFRHQLKGLFAGNPDNDADSEVIFHRIRDLIHRFDTEERWTSKGRWKLTTDAIGLDFNGRLINGQHRLEALTRTCLPQRFLVKVNLESEAFAVIDAGRPRSPADALHIAGFSHRFPRAAVIRMIAQAARGHLWLKWRTGHLPGG